MRDQEEDIDAGVELWRRAMGVKGHGWIETGVRAAKKGSVILNILWTKPKCETAKMTTPEDRGRKREVAGQGIVGVGFRPIAG